MGFLEAAEIDGVKNVAINNKAMRAQRTFENGLQKRRGRFGLAVIGAQVQIGNDHRVQDSLGIVQKRHLPFQGVQAVRPSRIVWRGGGGGRCRGKRKMERRHGPSVRPARKVNPLPALSVGRVGIGFVSR